MKIIFLIISFALFSTVTKAMDLSISMANKILPLESDVKVQVEISNSSEEEVLMPIFMVCSKFYLSFIIKDSSGNDAQYNGVMFDVNLTSDLELIMSQDSAYRQKINLSDCYTFKKGKYKIYAIYSVTPQLKISPDGWFGELKSNELSFSVH